MHIEIGVMIEGQRYPTENLGLSTSTKLKNMSLASPNDRKSPIE